MEIKTVLEDGTEARYESNQIVEVEKWLPQQLLDEYYDLHYEQIQMKEKESKFEEALKKAMVENGVKRIDTKYITFTYVPGGVRKSLDAEKLKEDGLYDLYLKESQSKDSLRVKFKED